MSVKSALHPRNKHRNGYDFKTLVSFHPELSSFIIQNKHNQQPTINFSDADAVKALNMALLKKHYQVKYWDFPKGYLCPPIPGRVDYIHYLHDLLKESKLKDNDKITILDIGTGATCIYPILGACEYDWNFVASDIDPISVKAASTNVTANDKIAKKIDCRIQHNASHIFEGIIKPNEYFHLTLCNPPFHKSLNDAKTGTNRKWKNLNKKNSSQQISKLNFGGQKAELWCEGGELAFVRNMIIESKKYREQVGWFTCLISKKEHLSKVKLYLKKAQVAQIKIVNMSQGQKTSRFIAWQF